MEVSQREGVTFADASVAGRPLYGRFGTYLGVLCEVICLAHDRAVMCRCAVEEKVTEARRIPALTVFEMDA